MGNIALRPEKLSTFRRVALGTWRTTYDPTVYGSLQLRMERALEYMERFRKATGKRVTVTHLVGMAVARALAAVPEANAILRWGRIYRRDEVTISFQVVMEEDVGGETRADLSMLTLRNADRLSLGEICDVFAERVQRIRSRQDRDLEEARSIFRRVPVVLVHWLLRLSSFFAYTLNWNLSRLGIPRDPFGAAMVTNVGSLGLTTAYAPLVPYSRTPMVIAVGAVEDAPVVEEGRVVPGKVMSLHATFDHRIMDGLHAARLARIIRACFADPEAHFGPIE